MGILHRLDNVIKEKGMCIHRGDGSRLWRRLKKVDLIRVREAAAIEEELDRALQPPIRGAHPLD